MIKIQFAKFEAYCREQLGLSEHSIRAYRQDLAAFESFAILSRIESRPGADDLVEYHRHLRKKKSASAATIRRRFATLRSYYRWLLNETNEACSPFDGLRIDLRVPRRLPRPVDRPTLSAVFQAARRLVTADRENDPRADAPFDSNQITGLVARILITTGMRIGEVTNLRIRDITGACSRITVRGKGNRERTVYVTNSRLLQDFRLYWEKRRKVDHADAFLFLNSRGARLTEPAFRKRLRAVSRSLMIEPHLTPHRFRHSAATLLIEEGVDIRIVQRLLGHASISTTEIYTKVSDRSLVAAIERADTLAHVDPS